MSSGKGKRPADNGKTSDDEKKSKLKKPRLSGSTRKESIPKISTLSIPRRFSEPYIATLPTSSFSATLGLEIFPVPSPPPEPVVDRSQDPGPSSSRSAAPTNPASSVDASRPLPSKSLVNNGQAAAEGMELRVWNEWNEFQQSVKRKHTVLNNNLLASKDSRPVVEEQALQVIHRPQNDTPMGIQREDLQNMELTQGVVPEAMQHPSGETLPPIGNILLTSKDSRPVVEEQILQVIHRPPNDMPMGIQRDDLQNMEHTQGEVPEAMQHPAGEILPIGNASAAMESSVLGEVSQEQQLEQHPRSSPRRIQSQEKKP